MEQNDTSRNFCNYRANSFPKVILQALAHFLLYVTKSFWQHF